MQMMPMAMKCYWRNCYGIDRMVILVFNDVIPNTGLLKPALTNKYQYRLLY